MVGLAPTNAVAQDLKADGFTEAGTVHAALFRLKNGRTRWDRDTVVMVDEAAMLDSRVTGELLAEARQAGAKVILAGDDRQLASIERGGLFTELRQRHGAAEITEVTRQRVDWQRAGGARPGRGPVRRGRGGVRPGRGDHLDRRPGGGPRARWSRPGSATPRSEPGASRFVFAYTNRDVDALNAELRQVRRDRGELAGADVRFETKHGRGGLRGRRPGAVHRHRQAAHIYNGNVGTITGIDAETGEITARLDAAAGQGREVAWSAAEFEGFRHGYAGTIYKGQGKTLDHTYLYHTHHWRSAASYVALTRQRESAQVFVARETARDAAQLARQMARGEVRAASVAWATAEEAAKVRAERQADPAAADRNGGTRQAGQSAGRGYVAREGARGAGRTTEVERRGGKAGGGPGPGRARGASGAPGRSAAAYWKAERTADTARRRCASAAREDSVADSGVRRARRRARDQAAKRPAATRTCAKAAAADSQGAEDRPRRRPRQTAAAVTEDERAPAPLLPAWRDPTGQGRDSLGRGTSPEDLARVADQDPAVLREADGRKRAIAGHLSRSRGRGRRAGHADQEIGERSAGGGADAAAGRAGGAGRPARA